MSFTEISNVSTDGPGTQEAFRYMAPVDLSLAFFILAQNSMVSPKHSPFTSIVGR